MDTRRVRLELAHIVVTITVLATSIAIAGAAAVLTLARLLGL